jgi:hypothetical protein
MQYAYDRSATTKSAPLNPNFRYLRATVEGRVVLLALGYVDPDPNGLIEVWYSADREVIKLQNGRVVSAIGFVPEWRNVEMQNTPSWIDLAKRSQPVSWVRFRDVMPGYRSGIVDNMKSSRLSSAQGRELVGLDPATLLWFEDSRERDSEKSANNVLFPGSFDGDLAIPPARFGVMEIGGTLSAVYGEQCLSQKMCFTWQHWPAFIPVPPKSDH